MRTMDGKRAATARADQGQAQRLGVTRAFCVSGISFSKQGGEAMGRLKALRSALGALPPRLGFVEGDARGADRARTVMAPWRAWYGLKRWQDLRLAVFVRDGFTCRRTGVLCVGTHPAPNSPVANHIRPHKGDPRLFWDIGNVETVSKAVHDSLIQAEERAAENGIGSR